MTKSAVPRIGVLGLAERAALVHDGGTNILKWNVLGLKQFVVSHIFPVTLSGWHLALVVYDLGAGTKSRIKVKDEAGGEIGFIDLSLLPSGDPAPDVVENYKIVLQPPRGWFIVFIPFGKTPLTIPRPGRYLTVLSNPDGTEETIGELQFLLVDPPPLTPERLAAIKSDPRAIKAVRIELGCQKCPSKSRAYVALERLPILESEGFIWHQDIPDEFVCQCGSTRIDQTSIRRNLFGMLGLPRSVDNSQLSLVPLYEKGALENLLVEYRQLLDSRPEEEPLQKFIEKNPVLLHQFPAERLFFKPQILTKFVADFGIVTPQKELVLIEIEKTTTRLLKKDGGQAAALQHAFDQVHSWLHLCDEHKLAVLDSLNIDREMVGTIRGVVVAGRDHGYDAAQLRQLKGRDRGRVALLTYDDLAFGLAALIRGVASL